MPDWQQGTAAPPRADTLATMPAAPTAELRRRRRSRQEAEEEILAAAAALLREQPLHAVSVSAIMEHTTLSRKSFYVYFRDRYELLTKLFTPLRRELDDANALFLDRPTGDLVTDARTSLHTVARFLASRDGALVRALHEASGYDREAARIWREFNEPVITALTGQLRREISAGRLAAGIDVEPTVRALVGMNLYCFFEQIVGNSTADVEAIAETLLTIWARTFLLSNPPPVRKRGRPDKAR